MIAWLGMYDMPYTRAATDRLWQGFARNYPAAPATLTRDGDPWDIWQSPDLLIAQTCGLPFRARLHDRVTLVATPDHGLTSCPSGHYFSVIVARAEDTRNLAGLAQGKMAYNEALSQSGWAAPLAHLADGGLKPGAVLQTGAHAASARAVAASQADFAALDAVTWAMLQIENPALTAQLRVVDETAPTPALPFITALDRDPESIATALAAAIADLPMTDRNTLHLQGLVGIGRAIYCALPLPPAA